MSTSRPLSDSFDQAPFASTGLFATLLSLSLFVILFGGGHESSLLLARGDFIYPGQWLSSLFVVPSFFFLLFQTVCLWVFAQIVEAKVGWKRLPLLALLPVILLTALEQLIALRAEEITRSTSNSRLIYHLAGLGFMWVPALEINPLGDFLSRRANLPSLKIPVWITVMVYVGLDAFLSNQFGTYSGPPVYNLLALALGMAIAYRMIHTHKVESEADDLLTVVADFFVSRKFRSAQFDPPEPEQPRKSKKKRRSDVRQVEEEEADDERHEDLGDEAEEDEKDPPRSKPSARLVKAFNTMIEGGNFQGALEQVQLIRQLLPEWQIPGDQLHKLIDQTQQMKFWHLCIPLMEEYASRFEGDADTVRLRLAKILVDDQQRPRHALRVLSQIPPDRLGPEMEKTRKKIEEAALVQIEDGVLELESGGWTPNLN